MQRKLELVLRRSSAHGSAAKRMRGGKGESAGGAAAWYMDEWKGALGAGMGGGSVGGYGGGEGSSAWAEQRQEVLAEFAEAALTLLPAKDTIRNNIEVRKGTEGIDRQRI